MTIEQNNRLKLVVDFLLSINKDEFTTKFWENGEGMDVIVDKLTISIPYDEEFIIEFEVKE